MGKSVFIIIDEDDIIEYHTINIQPAYKTLPIACIYKIDSDNWLNLFDLKRKTQFIEEAYLEHWLYYASFSPIWKERIETYGGIKNCENKTVSFCNSELEEEFYKLYGYEPDEQTKETQEKSICILKNANCWNDFYKKNTKNKNGNIYVK